MLDFQVKDGIATLTLQRPEVLNAINEDLANRLCARIAELETRSDARVLITRGEGRAFCAGSDLHELAGQTPADATKYELHVARILSALDRLPQPTIALLHGHVLGGGLGLAVYHDFRVASVTASLGMPEAELGWAPPWSVGRLAEVVGFSTARWLLLTCKRITGAEAAAIGLVHEAVPDSQLITRAEELATRIASMPPEAVKQTKFLLNRMSPLRRFEWDEAASQAFEECYSKPEAQQRIADFVRKRSQH